ncbi:hypothetical protein BGZ95_007089 [Linnemannia exigua]|uniref:WD40 repeat-like protein n=1 Tax=Linnemannia exigua TaxID=604196 RepID=A0AAD4HBA6_9FUNG|nr:hypothetical protein BGZ95_007089 [Linnemannia exigua]
MTNSPKQAKKDTLTSRLEERARKILGRTSSPKDKSIANALAAVQLGPGNVLVPHGYTGSDGVTQRSTTSSPVPSAGDLSNLTPTTSPRASVTGSPAPTQKSLPSAPTPPISSKSSTTTTTSTTIASTPVSKTQSKPASALAPKSEPWLSIFPTKEIPPLFTTPLPIIGARIESTAQLAYTNMLLRRHSSTHADEAGSLDKPLPLDPDQQALLDAILKEEEEKAQIRWLATRVVEEFTGDALKDKETISEVVLLGPVLDREYHRKLINVLIGEFEGAKLLDVDLLEGLVEMIQCAGVDYLLADDLVKILTVLRLRLTDTHQQTSKHPYHIVLAISRLLDVMVEGKVRDVNRVTDHEPLLGLLAGLAGSDDIYLQHQAAYAYQALLHIPNDESKRDLVLRHGTTFVQGILGVASIMSLDFSGFAEGLAKAHETIVGTIELVDKVVTGAQSMREGGQGLWEAFKGGVLSGGRVIWYMALREAQEHIRYGRLADFNSYVFKVPCCRNVEFQWGICLFLGEIAIDPLWNSTTREHAVEFLGEIYKNPLLTPKKPDATVYSWILNVLRQISELKDVNIANHAQLMIESLENEGVACAQEQYKECVGGDSNPFPIRIRLTPPKSFPLLTKVQQIPKVEYEINLLRVQRLKEGANPLFIAPQARPTIQSPDDTLFPLMEKAMEFLEGPHKVLLLLGESGAGKSTFNVELEHTLWENYKKYGRIPLYINLPTIVKPELDLITKQLTKCNFKADQIQEMKLHREFVVICDGYDESQLRTNLYTGNKWNQSGQWKVKVVISCREQYLGADYRARFQPQAASRYSRGPDTLEHLEEAVIAAFNMKQVKQYVEQYCKSLTEADALPSQPLWTKEQYMDKLVNIPNLMELVSNPFLLKLSLQSLPLVVQSKKDLSSIRITRVELYDCFVRQWLEVNRHRIEFSPLSDDDRALLMELVEDGFVTNGLNFQRDLAEAIFKEQEGQPIVTYTHLRDKNTWKAEFFQPDGHCKHLRDASAITRTGNTFRFIHRSLLEYFYSTTVYDPFKYDPTEEGAVPDPPSDKDLKQEMGKRSFISEPSVLQFLAERVQHNPLFEEQLLGIIEASKKDDQAGIAAANAMTILIRAGLQFNGSDLSGIRIPGADLRGGEFDSANLEGADLTNVTLSKAWLRRANLSKSRMTGVEFGELPFLKAADMEGVQQLSWSFDGKLLVALTGRSNFGTAVTVYDAATWERVNSYPGRDAIATSPTQHELAVGQENWVVELSDIQTGTARIALKGHDSEITCISFSPNGKLIAAGSATERICIWSTDNGECERVLSGPSFPVRSLVFAPSNSQLVSCGTSGSPQVWDVKSGEKLATLQGHEGAVESVAYSKDGHQIASGGVDGTVRLWDARSGRLAVHGVAYSRDGLRLASCSSDHTIRLWDPSNGSARNTLFGHLREVRCIAFSPTEEYIASGGLDGTTRLWGAGSGLIDAYPGNTSAKLVCVDISPDGKQIVTGNNRGVAQLWEASTGKSGIKLRGHKDAITEVAFSPCGQRIATASLDTTVRLWDAETGVQESVVIHQARSITCVSFSPDGSQLVTSGHDHLVRIWNSKTGEAAHALEGHKGRILKAPFSPSGHQVASCSKDGSVLVWDPKDGTKLFDLVHDLKNVEQVIYSPDGELLISVIPGEQLFCWDARTGDRVEMDEVDGNVARCSFTPDGKFLTVACRDGVIRLWNRSPETGKWTKVLKTMIGAASWMKWSKSDKGDLHLVTLDKTGNLCIWTLHEKQQGVYTLQLDWCSGFEELSLVEAKLEGIEGLSPANLQLMTQRASIH